MELSGAQAVLIAICPIAAHVLFNSVTLLVSPEAASSRLLVPVPELKHWHDHSFADVY